MNRGHLTAFFCGLFMALIFPLPPTYAVSPAPEVIEKWRADGRIEELALFFQRARANGVWQAEPFKLASGDGLRKANAGDTIKLRVLVLLVDFPDRRQSADQVSGKTAADFQQLLFSRGVTATGSMTDFYLENSYGKMLIQGDVYGWFTLSTNYSVYVGSDSTNGLQLTEPNAKTMVRDAVIAADPFVDFSLYGNGDNVVDGLFVIHAGPGAEEYAGGMLIWSHQWNIGSYLTNDGVYVNNYTTEPEEARSGMVTIGVFCHEYGHILGLPDLYDISYISSGIGNWSLMSGGSWNSGGRYPAHFDGWCKDQLDQRYAVFGRTVPITFNLADVVLHGSVSDSIRYRLTLPQGNNKEYFIIENRQQVGFDRALPGAGLLILHCDDNLSGSNDLRHSSHLRISVEQADGLFELENSGQESGDDADLFPYGNRYPEFTDLTVPSTVSYYGGANERSVWDIREDTAAKTITCNFDWNYSRTNLQAISNSFTDTHYGNGDGVFDAGERVEFFYTIKNFWKTANSVTVKLTSPTSGITMGINQKSYTSIVSGQEVNNQTAPFDFTVSSQITPVNAQFDLTMISGLPADTFVATFYKFVGGVEILLVDDDMDVSSNRGSYFTNTLSNLLRPYDSWNTKTEGTPGTAQYPYKFIIWFTGDPKAQPLTPAEVIFLKNYLDQGGNLFLTGQDIAEKLATTEDSVFLKNYLKVRFDSTFTEIGVVGSLGNAVGNGMNMQILMVDGAQNQSSVDRVAVLPGAEIPFFYEYNGGPAGSIFSIPDGYSLVFFGFGFEGISNKAPGYATREQVMERVLQFLGDNLATDVAEMANDVKLPVSFALEQNYPNPFNPSTVISYSISPKSTGQPSILEIYNILGQKTAELINGPAAAGDYRLEVDASGWPSGVYFYRLTVGPQSQTRKMVLIK